MEIESNTGGEDTDVSIPRGGPLNISDFVSPLTGIVQFQDLMLQELQLLKTEAFLDPSQICDEDFSVDELKIYSEEELVNMALNETFKDGAGVKNTVADSEEISNELTCPTNTSSESVDHSSGTADSKGMCNSKKRKRMGAIVNQNNAFNNIYMEKVEQFVKIKQKQDEDKVAARLHSFNGSYKGNGYTLSASERVERMKFIKTISSETKAKSSNIQNHIPVTHPEVILCIEIFHNHKQTRSKSQEFLVLGRQTLTELRDKIYCLTDEVMMKSGQSDPCGYFLIEDLFCNDTRDPTMTDYTEPIFNWLNNSRGEAVAKWQYIVSGRFHEKQKEILGDVKFSNLPHFKKSDMQKTRFCDLRFKLGAGYLYCHQGDCRHIFVIRDMRLIHPEDVNNRCAYPLITYEQKKSAKKCTVCKIYSATKVTTDDKRAQENPCYFCDKCYFLLHYSEDGSLLYNEFSVYDYFHD